MGITKKYIKSIRAFFFTLLAKRQIKKYGTRLVVNHYSQFIGDISIGNNCHFNGFKFNGGELIIGDNFHSGEDILILAKNHNYEGKAIPYDDTYIEKKVTIEDNVWLGDRVLIIGNVHIGEGVIVGAGAIITKNIPPLAIVIGNNKIIKYRNAKNYYQLKKMNCYH